MFFELVSLVVIVLCPLFSRGDSRFNHQFLLVIWNPLLFQSMPQFCCLNSHSLWETYKKLLKMAIEIMSFPIKRGDFP